ncbi:hypothetical protein DET56_11128 [Paenibacillus pabuli]|uniref:Uncharacterized protein n=1 Tax=Paenibacillus pabuli TaxID=1472 RepID=A0A855XS78_9BACL|nr:hypothetical protein DET56_11128 [Paenibacillus pabuli]PXW03075.1 hypothetical protein DEU73_11028 [Paenibacillus taichungensis]
MNNASSALKVAAGIFLTIALITIVVLLFISAQEGPKRRKTILPISRPSCPKLHLRCMTELPLADHRSRTHCVNMRTKISSGFKLLQVKIKEDNGMVIS